MGRIAPLLLLLLASCGREQGAFQEAMTAGLQRLGENDFRGAIEQFRRAQSVDSSRWEGYAFEAMAHVDSAIQLRPSSRVGPLRSAEALLVPLENKAGIGAGEPLIAYLRGAILQSRGEIRSALEFYEKAATASDEALDRYDAIPLRSNARRAYAVVCFRVGTALLRGGHLQQAFNRIKDSYRFMPAESPHRITVVQQMAMVCERMGRAEESVGYLRECIELSRTPFLREGYLAAMVMTLSSAGKLRQARAVLEEIPGQSENPEARLARCVFLHKRAMEQPEARAADAVDKLRTAMKGMGSDHRYHVAELFADLVLAEVGPREAKAKRALLEETVTMLERELKTRAECPTLYYKLAALYGLLGNAEKQAAFQRIHKQKQAAWKKRPSFDEQGRFRCQGGT